MAREKDRDHGDPELGVSGFLIPHHNNHNPHQDRSRISSVGSDCGDSRLADKSGSTDQSSLDPEQQNKPLILENYMIQNGENVNSKTPHMNGVVGNGIYHNGVNKNTDRTKDDKAGSGKKRKLLLAKLCCVAGTVLFVIGLASIVVSLFFIKNLKCDNTSGNAPVIGEQKHISDHITQGTTHHHNSHHGNSDNSSVNSSSTVLHNTTPTTTTLSLENLVNLASGKEAFQSSTYLNSDTEVSYPASLAIDGKEENTIVSGACSQTKREPSPSWWIDLGSYQIVKRIRITQASDCCEGDLSNFEVRIGQQKNLNSNILCLHHHKTALEATVDIQCHNPIYGRYVSIQLMKNNNGFFKTLTLCEVEIYSK